MLQLKDPSLLETRAYINGAWVEASDHYVVTNPATGEEIAKVADMPRSALVAAIDAAHDAKAAWAAKTAKERAVLDAQTL
jgi:succinate-semialdehyde dehydrogenase/glutarate-semialdehyde dehydrogenase